MHLKPVIYVSCITNLSDARYCAGMGADILGFVVDPDSIDYVSPEQYQAMIGWVAGPRRVVQISMPDKMNLSQVVTKYAPDLLHIPFSSLDQLPKQELPLVLEVSLADIAHATTLASNLNARIEYLLVTDLHEAKPALLPMTPPSLLAIDKSIESLHDFLRNTHAVGVALKGSRELSPGLKDYDHLAEILEKFSE